MQLRLQQRGVIRPQVQRDGNLLLERRLQKHRLRNVIRQKIFRNILSNILDNICLRRLGRFL